MDTISVMILIGLLGTGIGVALGLLIAGLRAERKTSGESEERDTDRGGLVQIVRVWRKSVSGEVLVELDKKMLASPSGLNKDQQLRLSEVLDILQNWVRPDYRAGDFKKDFVGQQLESGSESTTPSQGDVSPKMTSTSSESPVVNPIDMFADAIRTDVPRTSAETASIAAQVDEILQEKLVGSPLASRGIRVMELPSKGLVVMIGLQQYQEVEEVPDPDIRNLIQEAVAEWERRYWKV